MRHVTLLRTFLALASVIAFTTVSPAADPPKPKKIVLIAGPLDGGHPAGTHEYEKTVRAFKHCLDSAANLGGVRVEAYLKGWPDRPETLDDADSIVVVANGSDRKESDHPLLVGDRMQVIEKQMKRGCGLVLVHWAVFVPKDKGGDRVLDWVGGYFDYETGPPPRGWYSKIQTLTVKPTVHAHPISRGVQPFEVKEEFYFNMRFREKDPRLQPVLSIPAKGDNGVVAWAVERPGAGRGFGITGGHFFENWRNDDYRKLMLNAIVWTAGIDVPTGGVRSDFPGEREIGLVEVGKRSQVLILTGHDGPFHNWRETSQVLKHIIEKDGRLRCRVVDDPEFLAREDLMAYDLIVQNYVNWERPGLSESAKKNLLRYLETGRGLAVIHFANGAFHPSLPKAAEGDWPEYRKVVRRVWDHAKGVSGHDRYGPFRVKIAATKHPITDGMKDFDTIDELYYRQVGDESLAPLITAKSNDTGKEEPLAWAYEYGKARIFQTVLGHSAESLRKDGPATLIRRGAAWSARRELKPEAKAGSPTVEAKRPVYQDGKFGKALDARVFPGTIETDDRFRTPPLTVECWAKLASRTGFNILVSTDPKNSADHWEIYSYAGSGVFSVYMPGTTIGEIKSTVDICDNQWHHLAMTTDSKVVRLYIDGKMVKEQAVTKLPGAARVVGPLVIGGAYDSVNRIGCDGLIDDVRISNVVREIAVPKGPLTRDDKTVSLWNLDGNEGLTADTNWTPPVANDATEPWQRETDKDWVDGRFQKTDTGPFQNATFDIDMGKGKTRVYKGTAVKIGTSGSATIVFDRSTMMVTAGWREGYLNHSSRRFGLLNTPTAATGSKLVFAEPTGPGWAGPHGGFDAAGHRFMSPLPHEWAAFKGHYLNGDRVTFSYAIGSVDVLETPTVIEIGGISTIERTIRIEPSMRPLKLEIGRINGVIGTSGAVRTVEGDVVGVGKAVRGVAGSTDGVTLTQVDGKVVADIPPSKTFRILRVLTAGGPGLDVAAWKKGLASLPPAVDPKDGIGPGRALWTAKVETKVVADSGRPGPLRLETLTLPYDNPWKSLFFVTGVDFLPDGRIAICTAHGDIWTAIERSGVLTWKRAATGLYQPLGLKVVEGKIIVLERGQLTRLHDRNNDGEIDYFENVNSDWHTGGGEHSYDTCLETDPAGNFYFFKTGDDHTPTGGSLLRVSKDGKTMEIFSTGFRHPIGLGMSADGKVSGADQEGNWMPTTRLDMYKKGGFYGDMRTHHRTPPPTTYDPPLLWLPKEIDNSAGGQVWIPPGKFGSLGGTMLHLSYGRCKAYAVLPDGDRFQAGITDLGLTFLSGSARGRFNTIDDALYVVGLDGWQTAARADGSLQRIRYVPGPYAHPTAFRTAERSVTLRFDEPIDATSATAERFTVQRWNYVWSANYGSKDWSVQDAKKEGRDSVPVRQVVVGDQGRSVTLMFDDLKPAMSMKIAYDLKIGGAARKGTLFTTVQPK